MRPLHSLSSHSLFPSPFLRHHFMLRGRSQGLLGPDDTNVLSISFVNGGFGEDREDEDEDEHHDDKKDFEDAAEHKKHQEAKHEGHKKHHKDDDNDHDHDKKKSKHHEKKADKKEKKNKHSKKHSKNYHPKHDAAKIIPACAVEIKHLCSDDAKTKTLFETISCLSDRKDQISSECRTFLSTSPLSQCVLDLPLLCPHVLSEAAAKDCLQQKIISVKSDSCKNVLKVLSSAATASSSSFHETKNALSSSSLPQQPDDEIEGGHELNLVTIISITGGVFFIIIVSTVIVWSKMKSRKNDSYKYMMV